MTRLGQLLQDKTDFRRQPLHDQTSITLITFMALILQLQTKYGISVADMNQLLLLIRKIVPSPNKVPTSVSEINKSTSDLLVQHKEHLVCSCEQYRFKDSDRSCPVCKKTKDGAKKYYTIPIGPRIKQMKEVYSLAKVLSPETTHTRFVDDLHSSKAWADFAKDKGAIALSYCSDGFNPFHHSITQGSYSIWAQSGVVLNLPPSIRLNIGTTLIFGLISGPQAPKKLNIYNEVIIDELEQLKAGLTVYNASTRELEQVKVALLMMICDVPGAAKEQNRVQQNALASCSHCHSPGVHKKILDKTVYPGGRLFLEQHNPLRRSKSFSDSKLEFDSARLRTKQFEKSLDDYLLKLEQLEKRTGVQQTSLVSKVTHQYGRYGSSLWFRLDLDLQQRNAPVEPMHMIKVVGEHIMKILNGTEDGPKVRAQEREDGRFKEYCPDSVYKTYATEKQPRNKRPRAAEDDQTTSNNQTELISSYPKKKLPEAPFTLSPTDQKVADLRLNSLKVTGNFGELPTTLFTKITGGTKSHTWLQLYTKGILRYCLRDMLGKPQRDSLFNFLDCLEKLFTPPVDTATFHQLEGRWHTALCQLEMNFPLSLQSYVMHLCHHLPQYIKEFGPPRNFWMFPYERVNKTLSQSITNNRYPELNAIKHMEVQWLIAMLSSSGFFKDVEVSPKQPRDLVYLHAGTFRPHCRRMTESELDSLQACYKDSVDNCDMTVYHYADIQKDTVKHWTLHDVTSDISRKEKTSVIACDLPTGQFVGQVKFFFSHVHKGVTNELAYINWFGAPELCMDSFCYFVNRGNTTHVPTPIVDIGRISKPVVHAWEDNILWMPVL